MKERRRQPDVEETARYMRKDKQAVRDNRSRESGERWGAFVGREVWSRVGPYSTTEAHSSR